MQSYLSPLVALLNEHANPAQAVPMKKYMRGQFEYLGIKIPQLRTLSKMFNSQYGLPAIIDLDLIVHDLWNLPQREFQYLAVSFVERLRNELPPKFIKTMEYMIVNKSWWDTVDSIAGDAVGIHFQRFPAVREKYLAKWRASKNIWLRRSTILFQLGYKKETDFDLLCEVICENLDSKEFFINKAIGWSLRQYARVDPKAVKKFVKATTLHPLSRREAMKHLE
ncbi:MAG TPA: DNA alkylation repair protein [Anaerolineales bacterium]|nr:DNA alkylation repair protein [Anaerolineales bacterium]